jgi:sarcosine oxidase
LITANAEKIAVIGAGIIGTMTAWQLAKRGYDVTVFGLFIDRAVGTADAGA